MVLAVYRIIVGLLFWLSFPILLGVVLITGRHRRGVNERLGLYTPTARTPGTTGRLWIHAASIGEVRAAGVFIDHLRPGLESWDFVVTTMTIHGRDFARRHLGRDIACYLAPLDVPFVAGRVARRIAPDCYVCLETELWPILISVFKRQGAGAALINGRLSDKSFASYCRYKFFFGNVLKKFNLIAAITGEDRKRFIEVGAEPRAVTVTGNIKHDFTPPADRDGTRHKWRQTLGITAAADVIIAGSTHAPEEELLLPVYSEMTAGADQLWLIAPRHLDRLDSIQALLDRTGLSYDLLSSLKQGKIRTGTLILVDTFGDLTELFSIATLVFVGGTLAPCGGHNVMEVASWDKVVLFGPHINDFKASAAILEKSGAGFNVATIDEMKTTMESLLQDRDHLAVLQQRAGEAAAAQQGAGKRQAELVLGLIRGAA